MKSDYPNVKKTIDRFKGFGIELYDIVLFIRRFRGPQPRLNIDSEA